MVLQKQISAFKEIDSIRFLCQMRMLDSVVFELADKPPYSQDLIEYKVNVTKPIIENPKQEPGDIDICAFFSDMAFAFQVKKFKAEAVTVNEDRFIRGIRKKDKKVISQANGTLPFGFSKTGILLIVNYDGAVRSKCGPVYGGIGNTAYEKMKRLIKEEMGALDPECFVVCLELAQATTRPIWMTGTMSSCVFSSGRFRELDPKLRERLIGIKKRPISCDASTSLHVMPPEGKP